MSGTILLLPPNTLTECRVTFNYNFKRSYCKQQNGNYTKMAYFIKCSTHFSQPAYRTLKYINGFNNELGIKETELEWGTPTY